MYNALLTPVCTVYILSIVGCIQVIRNKNMRKNNKNKMLRDKYYYDFKQSLEQQAREEMVQRGKRYYVREVVWDFVIGALVAVGVVGVLLVAMAVFVD